METLDCGRAEVRGLTVSDIPAGVGRYSAEKADGFTISNGVPRGHVVRSCLPGMDTRRRASRSADETKNTRWRHLRSRGTSPPAAIWETQGPGGRLRRRRARLDAVRESSSHILTPAGSPWEEGKTREAEDGGRGKGHMCLAETWRAAAVWLVGGRRCASSATRGVLGEATYGGCRLLPKGEAAGRWRIDELWIVGRTL